MKKSELKELIKECISELNEGKKYIEPEDLSEFVREKNIFKKIYGKDFQWSDKIERDGIGKSQEKKMEKWIMNKTDLPENPKRYDPDNWEDYFMQFWEDFYYRQNPDYL